MIKGHSVSFVSHILTHQCKQFMHKYDIMLFVALFPSLGVLKCRCRQETLGKKVDVMEQT